MTKLVRPLGTINIQNGQIGILVGSGRKTEVAEDSSQKIAIEEKASKVLVSYPFGDKRTRYNINVVITGVLLEIIGIIPKRIIKLNGDCIQANKSHGDKKRKEHMRHQATVISQEDTRNSENIEK